MDAWLGARDFVASDAANEAQTFMTKQDYEEHGQGFFREHRFSNRYCATPEAVPKEEATAATAATSAESA